MSSVTTSFAFGSPVQVVYFTEELPGTTGTRLAAAVVWRVGPGSEAPAWRRRMRRLRFRLRALFGGFHLRGMHRYWAGSSGPLGEQDTRYDVERRIVRVLGREYPVPPDGRTLVLLVDEGTRANRRPLVVVRTVIAPVVRGPEVESTRDGASDADQRHQAVMAESQAWVAALETDPDVRAFMGGSQRTSATR
jgi:hypothetical protein